MHTPTIYQGSVGPWNVDELAQTGLLTDKVAFTLDSDVRETKAHTGAEALDQIVRTRKITRALMIDIEGEVILDANGQVSGIANAYAGQNLAVCAHFAAATVDDNGTVTKAAVARLGFTRDPAKLLQIVKPDLELSPETAAKFKTQLKYFPHITHTAAAA